MPEALLGCEEKKRQVAFIVILRIHRVIGNDEAKIRCGNDELLADSAQPAPLKRVKIELLPITARVEERERLAKGQQCWRYDGNETVRLTSLMRSLRSRRLSVSTLVNCLQ